MTEKKFLYYSSIIAIIMFCVMLVTMIYAGRTSEVPVCIGSFVCGWYLQKLIARVREVLAMNKQRPEAMSQN